MLQKKAGIMFEFTMLMLTYCCLSVRKEVKSSKAVPL